MGHVADHGGRASLIDGKRHHAPPALDARRAWHRAGAGGPAAVLRSHRRREPDRRRLRRGAADGTAQPRARARRCSRGSRERRSQLAGSLSGGEQQMLAIGRALMASPRLLLIDELSLGLMPKMVDLCLDALDASSSAKASRSCSSSRTPPARSMWPTRSACWSPAAACSMAPPRPRAATSTCSTPTSASRRRLSGDRGRERLSPPPPSEPDLRISRIRLSSRWSYPRGD